MTEKFGTLYYIAPEVIKGKYNNKCDVWSIGIIMFSILSGEVPFFSDDDREVIAAIQKGTFAFKCKV